MNVKEIIKDHLESEGFDGLASGQDCSCETSDLFPCDGHWGYCDPAYRVDCQHDCNEFDFCMSTLPNDRCPKKEQNNDTTG
jgi:hypothetical protein